MLQTPYPLFLGWCRKTTPCDEWIGAEYFEKIKNQRGSTVHANLRACFNVNKNQHVLKETGI